MKHLHKAANKNDKKITSKERKPMLKDCNNLGSKIGKIHKE